MQHSASVSQGEESAVHEAPPAPPAPEAPPAPAPPAPVLLVSPHAAASNAKTSESRPRTGGIAGSRRAPMATPAASTSTVSAATAIRISPAARGRAWTMGRARRMRIAALSIARETAPAWIPAPAPARSARSIRIAARARVIPMVSARAWPRRSPASSTTSAAPSIAATACARPCRNEEDRAAARLKKLGKPCASVVGGPTL